jgi:hypothetical protein
MKTVVRMFVVLLVMAFVLSACGGATPTPAKVFTAADFKPVTLTAADFPQGFEILTAADAQSMGLDLSSFEGSMAAFTKAGVVNTVVAMNSSMDAFQVVVAFVLAPMTSDEAAAFDKELDNPESAKTQSASGLGGQADFLAGADKIGDKSIGFDLTIDSGGVTLRGELVISRRGAGLQMIVLLWLETATKQVNAVDLAKKLDTIMVNIQK